MKKKHTILLSGCGAQIAITREPFNRIQSSTQLYTRGEDALTALVGFKLIDQEVVGIFPVEVGRWLRNMTKKIEKIAKIFFFQSDDYCAQIAITRELLNQIELSSTLYTRGDHALTGLVDALAD